MKLLTVGAMFLMAGVGSAFAQPKAGGPPPGPGLTLTSPDFEDGGIIPNKYTQADPEPGFAETRLDPRSHGNRQLHPDPA